MENKLEFEYLPIDEIDVSFFNVRKSNPEENIDELTNSIKEIGVQQPVVVFKKNGRYELIIGQRRYLACKKLKKQKIPAIITTIENDIEALILSFSENIHRLDLEYRDKMTVATKLLSEFKDIKKVAEKLGVSVQTVRNWLGYSAVPEQIKEMVEEQKLGATTALNISKGISDTEKAIKVAKKVSETPRSRDKRLFIRLAKENPEKSVNEISAVLKVRRKNKITIDLTPNIVKALKKACETYESEPEEITLEALEEWLKRRGFY